VGQAFRNSVQAHAPQAQALFDKFDILRHLAEAMDQVRRAESKRGAAKDRAYITGQRDTRRSHRAHLTLAGRRSLRKLLRANTRLATAYLLKEEFGHLWAYGQKGGARQFFTHWQEHLIGDRAYDSDRLDEDLKQGGANMIAPHRSTRKLKTQDGRHLRRYQRRWLVERFFAWLQWQRRLLVRWEYYATNFLGFVQLACITMLLTQF
jgi:transposase